MIYAPCAASIESHHLQEWLNSGVSQEIISRNVRTIHDAREVDKILSRNEKRRWKHSSELVPCWQVSGLEPLTGEPTLQGVQVKPDVTPLNKDGKPQKYLGASGYGTCPLFLSNGIEGYWQSVAKNALLPVIYTEGAKKAGAGLSINYATISIPGVSTCRKNGRLHYWLQPFTGFGRISYLCFDNDALTKKPVQDALLGMARELSACGSKVMVIKLPPGELKGMDDFIASEGKEAFDELVNDAITIEEWRQDIQEQWRNQNLDIEEERNSKLAKYIGIVKSGWGDSLRLNKLKNSIELNGSELDINHIRLRIALEFDTDVPIGDSQGIVEMIASENSYNPVVDYLDTLSLNPEVDTSILDGLATRYFGSTNPLHNIYMKKQLIAAVARVKNPGCKHDVATILVGKQGAYKSTFWKKLFGEDWFTDELGDANERDELMKLHRFWCLEWSEFETVYRKKDVATLKKFMSSTIDAFRTPYSRTVKEYPRSSILVGTTNEEEILTDPTGSRRFWIIPVNQDIPINLVCSERDKIWSAANALYNAGAEWWLTPEEQELQQEANIDFEVTDPWMEPVNNFIRDKQYVTVSQVLTSLDVEPSRQDVSMAKRVGSVLRRLHWKQTRKRINSENLRCWTPDEKKLGFSSGTPGTPGTFPSETQNSQVERQTQQILVEHPSAYIQQDFLDVKTPSVPGVPLEIPNFLSEQDTNGQPPGTYATPIADQPTLLSTTIEGAIIDALNQPPSATLIKAVYSSPLGQVKAIALFINDEWQLRLFLPDGSNEASVSNLKKEKEMPTRLKKFFASWLKRLCFKVRQMGDDSYYWVEDCKSVECPVPGVSLWWAFETPAGDRIRVRGEDEFEVMS